MTALNVPPTATKVEKARKGILRVREHSAGLPFEASGNGSEEWWRVGADKGEQALAGRSGAGGDCAQGK
jgi:hypothetical protein